MLKWTYAYGYYAFEVEDTDELKRQRVFFEFLQVLSMLLCVRDFGWETDRHYRLRSKISVIVKTLL